MVCAGYAQPPISAAHASAHAVSKDQTYAGKRKKDKTDKSHGQPQSEIFNFATTPQHDLIPEDRLRALVD